MKPSMALSKSELQKNNTTNRFGIQNFGALRRRHQHIQTDAYGASCIASELLDSKGNYMKKGCKIASLLYFIAH